MIFGRVEAIAEPIESDPRAIRITVVLESARSLMTVRSEAVPALGPIEGAADLAWHADQYAQETIGTQLAEEGWEVIGAEEAPPLATDEVPRSRRYVVRRL